MSSDLQLSNTSPNTHSLSNRIWAVAVAIILFLLVAWTIILSGNESGRGASDDLKFHWVTIQQFADELPNPDLSDYHSATTPGYHLLLAPIANLGVGHTGIQLIASIWTLVLIGVLTWVLASRFGKSAVVLMLPMITSMYILFPGIWLLPDNAGWFGVLLILLLSLREHPTWKTHAISGLLLIALIWMRQIHIWAAGIVWISAWLGSCDQTPSLRRLFSSPIDRIGRTFIAIACTIPAFTMLIWFMILWGGLVPPTFQGMHQGPNLATPGFILTQLAIMSVFFVPMLLPRLKETWAYQGKWIIAAALVGLILGIVPENSYSYEAGRYGGWWQLVAKLPTIADRSPIIMLGSIAGAIALVVWLHLAELRDRWIWVGMMVAFTLAQSANHASWQRYHEPMLLIMILLIIARSTLLAQYTRRVFAGCVALSLMLGLLTAASIINAKPVDVDQPLDELQTLDQIEPEFPSMTSSGRPSMIFMRTKDSTIPILSQYTGFVGR